MLRFLKTRATSHNNSDTINLTQNVTIYEKDIINVVIRCCGFKLATFDPEILRIHTRAKKDILVGFLDYVADGCGDIILTSEVTDYSFEK